MPDCESLRLRLFDNYDGFARLWLPSRPRGAVLYLHGIQSHGLWFEASARQMADAGFAVLLPDRRGSGRNQVDRGHAASPAVLLRDASDYLDYLHVRTGLDRFHVLGVSWGGKLALALMRAMANRIASLALVAPGLFPRVDLPLIDKVRLALASIAAPRVRFDIPLNDPQLFTANPEKQRFIRHDPLALRQATAGFLITSRRLDRHVRAVCRSRDGCPLRVFLAGQDRIIDNRRTKALIRRMCWPVREITEYPNAHHTLEFEPDPEPFYADLLGWLTANL